MNREDFDKAVDRLQRPFALRDLDWVPNFTYPKDGDKNYSNTVIGVAAYVRREAVITRFNVVCGPGEWENIMQSLGNFGLYQGIAINCEGEWIRKFDGAQIDDDSSRIDAVKAVVSRSIRRVGEVWGVGLYLQYIPQLYAIKRPEDYYDAQFKWSNNNGLTIRWDPPQLPKEYIPKYMTPEQYVRMKRIIPYFSEASQKKAEKIIAAWESDPDSVDYETAEMTIGAIEDRILKRLNSIDNRKVTLPNKTGSNSGKNTPSQDSPSDTQSESQNTQGSSPPAAQPQAPQQESGITSGQFKELHKAFKKVEKLDSENIWVPADKMQEIRQAANAHYKGDKLIDEESFNKWIEILDQAIAALEDDLPF